MQVETTIIETSNETILGTNFQIKVYEQKLDVFCDCCDNQAHGSKSSLENQDWNLGQCEQFCPKCNF